jgi:hypothetical protein
VHVPSGCHIVQKCQINRTTCMCLVGMRLNACSWCRDDIQSHTYFYVTLYVYLCQIKRFANNFQVGLIIYAHNFRACVEPHTCDWFPAFIWSVSWDTGFFIFFLVWLTGLLTWGALAHAKGGLEPSYGHTHQGSCAAHAGSARTDQVGLTLQIQKPNMWILHQATCSCVPSSRPRRPSPSIAP